MISQEEVITKSQDPTTILAKLQEIQQSQAGQGPAPQGGHS